MKIILSSTEVTQIVADHLARQKGCKQRYKMVPEIKNAIVGNKAVRKWVLICEEVPLDYGE